MEASLETLVARWTVARPIGAKVAKIVGAPARLRWARVIGPGAASVSGSVSGASSSGSSVSGSSVSGASSFDPYAALAEVRVHGHSFFVGASSAFVREIAQRKLYGPEELDAPRPLTQVEHAVFAGIVAAAITDAKIAADVWPVVDAERARARLNSPIFTSPTSPTSFAFVVELALEIDGRAPVSVLVWCPSSMRVASPPPRSVPTWELELPIIVGSCALHRDDVGRLHVRDVITVDRQLGLLVGEGLIALSATPGAVEAKVASDYVRRDMALPDDAHLELTVQLGTTRLSLRQLSELVPGAIVPLGRPLAGPFEVRAAGRLVGEGELVDVDGELGVRIVSLQE